MASLRIPLLAALILFTVALQTTEAGPYGANVEDSICCWDYLRYPLPYRLVKNYYWTSDSCRRTGIVLLTGRGRKICADPKMLWVQKILQKLPQ